jgi:hypothetical protein
MKPAAEPSRSVCRWRCMLACVYTCMWVVCPLPFFYNSVPSFSAGRGGVGVGALGGAGSRNGHENGGRLLSVCVPDSKRFWLAVVMRVEHQYCCEMPCVVVCQTCILQYHQHVVFGAL